MTEPIVVSFMLPQTANAVYRAHRNMMSRSLVLLIWSELISLFMTRLTHPSSKQCSSLSRIMKYPQHGFSTNYFKWQKAKQRELFFGIPHDHLHIILISTGFWPLPRSHPTTPNHAYLFRCFQFPLANVSWNFKTILFCAFFLQRIKLKDKPGYVWGVF